MTVPMLRLRRASRPRGFVMILVLLVVVALTAAVLGQLAVVQSQKLASLRDDDQVRARATAEACLARARLYVNQLRDEEQPDDFGLVLDPELNSHPTNGGGPRFDDDFVPRDTFGGSVVYIPPSEASQTGLRQALHRFRFLPVDGGGCFVRFDDNSDDTRASGGDTSAGFEGNGNNIPFRDMDTGIFVTAIGVFPVPPGTAPADAYTKAKARVSLRVFTATGGAPGVVAHDDLAVQSNVAICGQGGFQGDNLVYSGGGNQTTVCACGDTATADNTAPPQPNDCNYSTGVGTLCANTTRVDAVIPCQPGAAVDLNAPPDPDVRLPKIVDWLQFDAFIDPKAPDTNLGTNGVCEFYFRSDNVEKTWSANPTTGVFNNNVTSDVETDFMTGTLERGEMFVWDHTDNDAQGCRTNTPLASCSAANVVTHDCRNLEHQTHIVDGQRVVKRPCRWLGGDNQGSVSGALAMRTGGFPANNAENAEGPVVQCTDPAKQSPCWKLVSRFTENSTPSRAVMQQDHDDAEVCSPACTAGNVCHFGVCRPHLDLKEPTATNGTEVFSPVNTRRVPNIEAIWGDPRVNGTAPGVTGSFNDGTTPTITSNFWTSLCGPCPSCTGIQGWELQGNEHFHFEKSPMCGDNFFNPAIMVFENQNDSLAVDNETGRFHVRADWGKDCTVTPRATIIVQATADIDLNTRICGAYADCSDFPADCARSSAPKANGLVLRAGGECYIGSGAVFIGDMQCGIIHVNNGTGDDCIVGDLVTFNDTVDHPKAREKVGPRGVCPDTTAFVGFVDDCSKGFCAKANFKMVGDIVSDGDVCIRDGAQVFGSVLAGGDTTGNIYIESNVTINGQLVSEGDIGIKTNTVINNNGIGTFGTRVTSGIVAEGAY